MVMSYDYHNLNTSVTIKLYRLDNLEGILAIFVSVLPKTVCCRYLLESYYM